MSLTLRKTKVNFIFVLIEIEEIYAFHPTRYALLANNFDISGNVT